MSHTYFTKDILEAMEIDATPMTPDQIFEREQKIEARWLEQFKEQETEIAARYERMNGFRDAQAKIGEAAQSALHNKNVVISPIIPHGMNTFPVTVDQDAVTEVIDATITYITMGRDFEIILQAIKDNPTLKSEWDRFCMMLRLAEDD